MAIKNIGEKKQAGTRNRHRNSNTSSGSVQAALVALLTTDAWTFGWYTVGRVVLIHDEKVGDAVKSAV